MINLEKLRKEFENELTDNILNYWIKKVYDPHRRTFIGVIDREEKPDPDASLGVVLISRILWTFSAAYHFYPTAIYRKMADEAWRILTDHFLDNENGGVYWSVTPSGEPVNDSKQFYAQAFALYAAAEYSRIFNLQPPKQLAVSIYHLMEKYASEPQYGGYTEARSRNWESSVPDFITPSGDRNLKKSMNTHLHILEAYTNLYRIYPEPEVKASVISLLEIFEKYIINSRNYHFHMFFDAEWNPVTTAISYGHDIEGTWLLHEAAEVIRDENTLHTIELLALKMADAVGREALDKTGGLYNESDGGHWDKNFHWWPQAEAVVGFFNAYQLSRDLKFLTWSGNTWKFIKEFLIDKKNGEWFWMITPDYTVGHQDKVSAWKCPYHNGRMCMEMIRRINAL
jgi:mannobiose 2-epimerase